MESKVRLTALDNNRPLTLYFDSIEEARNWADGRDLTIVEIRILAYEPDDTSVEFFDDQFIEEA